MLHVIMFNLNTLEQDIERLSREVREKQNLPENKNLSQREVVKQAIQPLVKSPGLESRLARAHVAPPAQAPTQTAPEEQSVLPGYLENSPAELKLKIEQLIDEVFRKGLEEAIEDARKAGPFVVDAFHDALTDKLHEELIKRKLI
jgi:hypothetical protein